MNFFISYLEPFVLTALLLSVISYKMMEDVRGQDPRAKIIPLEQTVKVMCTNHV
jgi:hypothetical protein